MDALGKFEVSPTSGEEIFWITIDRLSKESSLYHLCLQLSYIPFELNSKLNMTCQIIHHYRFVLYRANIGFRKVMSDAGSGVKYACIVPIVEDNGSLKVNISEDVSIDMNSGDLLIYNPNLFAYGIEKSADKKFLLSALISGPT
jgi:hypothetical protein